MKVEEMFRFFWVGCMRWGLDAGILAKGAMRHFWKVANRAFIACAGKIFWGNCFLEKFGERESMKLTQSVGMITGQRGSYFVAVHN